ncbi:MAG: acyltransferase [Bacteroidales bacterium]
MSKVLLSEETIARVKKENSFDFIRYLLAISIFISHFSVLTDSSVPWPIPASVRVKGFFIMSGFLVFLSFARNTRPEVYFSKRFYRLMPGYIGVVLFGFLLSLLVCETSPLTLLSDPQAYKYLFANLFTLNFLQPDLPGVFTNQPIRAINGSLWTIKVEILLYLTVPLVYWLSMRFKKGWIIPLIYLASVLYSEGCSYLYQETGSKIYEIMNRQVVGQMKYFYAGTFILCYFNRFCKYIRWIYPAAIVLFMTGFITGFNLVILRLLEPIALASLLIGLAYFCKPLNFLRRYDNISYGIYLYHYPVIQLLIWSGLYEKSKLGTFLVALFMTISLAAISWHFLEKNYLSGVRGIASGTSRRTTKQAVSE